MPGITNPAEEYFKDGQWGWDGTQWRKSALPFGYTAQVLAQVLVASAAGGTNILTGSGPSTGEIWCITAMEMHDATTGVTSARLGVLSGGVYYWAATCAALAAAVGFSWSGSIYLVNGDVVVGRLDGCTAGDALYLNYLGYKMAVV